MHLDKWLKQVYEDDVLNKEASGLEVLFDRMSPNDLLDIACGRTTIEKVAAKMTMERREALPAKSFAVPETKAKKIGVAGEIKGEAKGKYPIPDAKHARNALARVSQKGTPAERQAVRSKVYSKFPGLKEGFQQSHGGESPTSKENIKKVEQGGIGKTSAAKLRFMDKVARELARTHYQVKLAQEEEVKKDEKKCPECEGKGCEKCKEKNIEKVALIPGIVGYYAQGDPEATPRSGFWRGMGGGLVGSALGSLPGLAMRNPALAMLGSTAGGIAGGYLGGRTARATPEELAMHQAKQRALSKMTLKELGKGKTKEDGFCKEDEFTSPEAQEKAKVMQKSLKVAKGAAPPVRKKLVAETAKALQGRKSQLPKLQGPQ